VVKPSIRRVLIGIAVLLMLPIIAMGYAMLMFNAPPFPLSQLERLKPGMSQLAVENVLGKPHSIYSNGRTWACNRIGSWPIVYVYYDEHGKMTETVYDY
jgi:hypothetical protein